MTTPRFRPRKGAQIPGRSGRAGFVFSGSCGLFLIFGRRPSRYTLMILHEESDHSRHAGQGEASGQANEWYRVAASPIGIPATGAGANGVARQLRSRPVPERPETAVLPTR